MKVFGKILAALSILLVLGSLLMSWVLAIIGPHTYNPYTHYIWQTFPVVETMTCLTQLLCGLLLLVLVGRKRGGAVPEILILLFMILCLPLINVFNTWLWYVLRSAITLSDYSNLSLVESLTYYLEQTLLLQDVEWFRRALYDMGYVEEIHYFVGMAGSNLAQLLIYVTCGIGIGLTAKNKKQK